MTKTTDDLPDGYDAAAQERALAGFWAALGAPGAPLAAIYRAGEAAGFRRGIATVREQFLRMVSGPTLAREASTFCAEEPQEMPLAPKKRPRAAPAPPAPEPAGPAPTSPLAMWTRERDEVLRDGWLCWAPDSVILDEIAALPGLPVTAADIAARAQGLGELRQIEYREECQEVWRRVSSDTFGARIDAIYDIIAAREQRKRDIQKAAQAIAAASAGAQAPKDALSAERRFLLESEWGVPGVSIPDILARYNAMPGPKTDRLGLTEIATRLKLERAPSDGAPA